MMTAHHCGPACQHGAISITLGIPEQRRLVESQTGEPCFRMWLTRAEFDKGAFADWTAYDIDAQHVAIWRKRSDVMRLLQSKDAADRDLGMMLQSRELPDAC